jgi:hypothetical protein
VVHEISRGHSSPEGISNGSLSRIKIEGKSWAILEWNGVEHLERGGCRLDNSFGGGRGEG